LLRLTPVQALYLQLGKTKKISDVGAGQNFKDNKESPSEWYQPIDQLKTPDYSGPFQQQLRHPAIDDPWKQFYSDLHQEILNWIDSRNHVIVCTDANEDIRHGDTIAFCASLDTRDLILD